MCFRRPSRPPATRCASDLARVVQLEWTEDPHGNLSEIVDEVDPMDAAEAAAAAVSVSYSTGHGLSPLPTTFCAISSPSDRCSADNLIDMQDEATRNKIADAHGARAIDKHMAVCLNAASHGATQPVTLEGYIEACGRGHSANLGPMGPLTVSLAK